MNKDFLYYEEKTNRFVFKSDNPNVSKIFGVARARMGSGYVYVFSGRYPDAVTSLRDFNATLPEPKANSHALKRINYLKSVPDQLENLTLVNSLDYEFAKPPYMHQLECIEYLLHCERLAVLAEQGLGKTFIAVCYLELLRKLHGKDFKALVLAPRIVLKNWQVETTESTDLTCMIYRGDVDTRRALRQQIIDEGQPDVVITNYETATPIEAHNREFSSVKKSDIAPGVLVQLRDNDDKEAESQKNHWYSVKEVRGTGRKRTFVLDNDAVVTQPQVRKAKTPVQNTYNWLDDFAFLNSSLDYDVIIMDEGSRLKGVKSKRSGAIQTLADRARFRVLLSGTITLGNPLDVYQPFTILNPLIFGTNYYKFRGTYCEFSPYNKHVITGYKKLDALKSYMDPYLISKTKDECLDLPKRIMDFRSYELSPSQRDLYNAIVTEEIVTVNGVSIDVSMMLVKLNKILQVLGGFVILPIQRDDTVCNECEHLQSCLDDDVYPWNRRCKLQGSGLVEHIKKPKREYYSIPGGSSKLDLLDSLLDDVQGKIIIWAYYEKELQDIQTLLKKKKISYITADEEDCDFTYEKDPNLRVFLGQVSQGIGITLNSAKTMVYYSHSLNLEDRLQSMERNLRIGQDESVLLLDFVNWDTVESEVLQLLRKKEDVKSFIQRRTECHKCLKSAFCFERGIRPYSEACIHYEHRKIAEEKESLRLSTI